MSDGKKRYWIFVGAVWLVWLLASAAAWLLVLAPQQGRYVKVHKSLKAGQDEVELARVASLQATRRQQTEALDKLRDEMNRYAIDPMQQDRLVFEVSRVASELELTGYAGRIRISQEKGGEGVHLPVNRVFFDVKFFGTFDQFARFMNALERHRPVLFVENASIVRTTEGDDLHQAELLLSILVQVEKEKDAPAGSRQTAQRIVTEETTRI